MNPASPDDNYALTRTGQARTIAESIDARTTAMQTGYGQAIQTTVAPEDMVRAFPSPPDPFVGAGAFPFTKAQEAILGRPLTDSEIHIRPDDGNLYLPGVYYRRRLNEAFGMGGWALVPVGEPGRDSSGRNPTVYYTGRLYVLGRFAAQSMGKGTFIANNPKSDYGTALESARTDCPTRCAKDWVSMELWDPDFSNTWRAKHCQRIKNPDPARFGNAVYVWVKNDDSMFAEAVPVKLPPNVPVPMTSKETGQPIMGSWPQYIPDPRADAERQLDDDYRRAVGVPARSDLEVQLQRSIDENTIEVIDRKTGEVSREVKATKPQIAKIHILIRETGYSEDAYRSALKKYYAVDSSSLLTKAQAEDAILRLERTKARVPPEMLRVVPDGETENIS
jgi:hypothetical protein